MNNIIIPKYQFYISKLTDEGAWIAEETPVFANSEKELKQLYQMTGNTITIHRCEINPEYITKNSTNKTVRKTENIIQPVVEEQPNTIDNNSTEINGDISKMKFKIGDYPTDNVNESVSYNHLSIEQLQNTSIKKERRYSINGTNFKVDTNGKLFVEKWVDLSDNDPKIRIVYNKLDKNGTPRLIQLDGKHIEILKWVEAGEDCE